MVFAILITGGCLYGTRDFPAEPESGILTTRNPDTSPIPKIVA